MADKLDVLDEREAVVGGEASGLGQAELAPNDIRAEHDRDHLVERVAPAHALAAHAAIGRKYQSFG